ncbi:MAG: DNA mismatch repair protein MutT, partial [Bacteroidales bacterium]
LSLLGGFINHGESVNDAVQRVLLKLTGMENLYLEQVGTYGNVDRDPGGRVISVVYYALINIEDYDHTLLDRYDAQWIPVSDCDQLIMDHKQMVHDAIIILRRKASAFAVGFNLLPEKF